MTPRTFNNEAEAALWARSNGGTYKANTPEAADPRIAQLNNLYNIVQQNPDDEGMRNLYTKSLYDFYDPMGSAYEMEQQKKKEDLAMAELLLSLDNEAANASGMKLISKYQPDIMGTQETQTTVDPYQIQKNQFAEQLKALTSADSNFNPTDQNQINNMNFLSKMASADQGLLQKYNAPVSLQERLGRAQWNLNPFAAFDTEAIRRKRLGY